MEGANVSGGGGDIVDATTTTTLAEASATTTRGGKTSSSTAPQQQQQISKLRDANLKYKNLLKLAKERIQQQEHELELQRDEIRRLERQLEQQQKTATNDPAASAITASNQPQITIDETTTAPTTISNDGSHGGHQGYDTTISPESNTSLSVVRVCQRVRVVVDDDHSTDSSSTPNQNGNRNNNQDKDIPNNGQVQLRNKDNDVDADNNDDEEGRAEIWALIEFDTLQQSTALDQESNTQPSSSSSSTSNRYYKKWMRFDTDHDLVDYIRRDTGEPLTIPPYSLSPTQSASVQQQAQQMVANITEEYRRFRVKSELIKKQLELQLRNVQAMQIDLAQRNIQGQDLAKELEQARSDHVQLERLKMEMAEQETRWKEAYDLILTENTALKSSGSEALLAAQWRQRYESCLIEKDELTSRLQKLEMEKIKQQQHLNHDDENDENDDADHHHSRRKGATTSDAAGKYERKYRDIKESFRLYRKKAKEIFEAQQRGDVGLLSIADRQGDDAKLSYLKNLMVSYMCSDSAVREHMEGAIGTILKFSPDDVAKIEQKRAENDRWF